MEKIIFHKETKTFHLYNEEISYIMCVLENGHMGQLYYGKRIHDKPDLLPCRKMWSSDDFLHF